MSDSSPSPVDGTAANSDVGPTPYQRVLDYLYGRLDYERTTQSRDNHEFRLERTVALFESLALGGYLFHSTQSPSHQINGADPRFSQKPPDSDASSVIAKNPVPVVHIAGTKGKGSTASMVSSILVAAGYRVGLYTSPHLTDLEERFRIDGVPCSRDALVDLVDDIRPTVDRLDRDGEPISFFELTTAIAVAYFDRNECDVIVLEVGLGGRLDCTNVCASSVAAITSIGLDHQRVLGDTLAKIAAEKAGIIKGAVPVISGVTDPEAAEVVRRVARAAGSDLLEIGQDFEFKDCRETENGNDFVFLVRGEESSQIRIPMSLPLVGKHQVHNATIAVSLVRRLSRAVGTEVVEVTDAEIRRGLESVHCSGRLERFWLPESTAGASPVQIIVDTAHNHDSMVALCDTIDRRVVSDSDGIAVSETDSRVFRRGVVVVFAVSRDKDGREMAEELMKVADQIVCTEFVSNPRSLSAGDLYKEVVGISQSRRVEVSRESDPQDALTKAIKMAQPSGTVVISGSFFLAGELRPAVLSLAQEHPSQLTAARNRPDVGGSAGRDAQKCVRPQIGLSNLKT